MNYFFSDNKEVKKYIDKKLGKLATGGNFTAFNENWKAQEDSIEAIASTVQDGNGLCAWHLIDGKRTRNKTGCIKAGLLIIDIDNQADGKDENGNKIQKQELNVDQIKDIDICTKYLSLAYYSPSHTESWPRFRLVFGLEKPIIDTDFYQWFTRQVAKDIPGSDIRATQIPNLFYGCKDSNGIITVTDKYIPANKIDEAYAVYVNLSKDEHAGADPQEALALETSPDGVSLTLLLSKAVQDILEGEPVDDRSSAMARAFKEIIGWTNWLKTNGIPVATQPLDVANQVFYAIYEYSPELDGKFYRILNSITDANKLQPAIVLASEDGELNPWKRLRSRNREIYNNHCPATVKEQIKQKRSKARDSVLHIGHDDFELSNSSQTTQTIDMTSNQNAAPNTPAQLIQIQANNRQFSENDIAEIIVNNYGDAFLFDSSLDEFFAYDEDEGVWFMNDEQHIKRRIIKTLDTFIRSGVLPRYTSATVNSVFQILKAKLLRSCKGGRASIWQASRGLIPFRNGVLNAKTLEFKEGNDRDLYFQTKLLFDYDPNSKCPNFLNWLEWAVGKDKVVLIRAFCRAILTGYTTGERFLHLIGPGGSGKSTLQQVLIALAGYTGTHTSDLETIETNRFECHSLIGKRLLLLTDEASFSKRLDTLKKLTSASDTLRAERKYGTQVVNFKPELLVSIASNEHISSSDISSGLERRRLTIVMDKVIDPSKRRDLLSVFPDRIEGEFAAELSGIAAWLLEMSFDEMKDALANPTKHCPDLNNSNLEALVFNNPICAWLADCTLYAPNSHAALGAGAYKPNIDESERGMYVKNAYSELYASYVNYCKSNGYKSSAKPRFVDRLKETVNNVLKVPGIMPKYWQGKAVVTGLRLKPYDPTTSRAAQGPTRLPSPVEWAADPTIWDEAFALHDAPQAQSDEQQN